MTDGRLAVLGGSFDPVHLGHLFLLHCAVSMTDYRSFLLVPAKVSNFKQDARPSASDRDRIRMLRLALEDFRELYPQDSGARIDISTMEIDRGGVSYTSDSVRILKEQYATEGRIALIMGDDHIDGLKRWHDYDYLKDNVEFLICRRDATRPLGTVVDRLPDDIVCRLLEPDTVAPQSSSAVRSDLNGNLDFLSPRVRKYVTDFSLYK